MCSLILFDVIQPTEPVIPVAALREGGFYTNGCKLYYIKNKGYNEKKKKSKKSKKNKKSNDGQLSFLICVVVL